MPGPLHTIQASFAGGEFSPSLFGRVDIQKYNTGLKKARNVNVIPHGGVRNRPGTKMVSAAGDSTHPVRVIPFTFSSGATFILEFGHLYIRFYTLDAQIQASSTVTAWVTGHSYVVGNFVTQGGNTYYCLVPHTSGTFATDLAAGDWVLQTAYQIPSPYAGSDLFNLKFTQSASVLYIAHNSYAPQQLTRILDDSWTIAAYAFAMGPFMLQNSDSTSTITPSAISGTGITLTASKSIFVAGHVSAFFELIATIVGQTISPTLTASVLNWLPTGTTWQCVTTGTWSGTILVQTSPDEITWTTVATVTTNTTVSGNTGFALGYMRAIMQSSLAFSGSATATLTGDGSVAAATNLGALNAVTPNVACGTTATITITGTWSGTVSIERSDDGGVTWNDLATTYTTNQSGTTQSTGKAIGLIRAKMTAYTSGTAVVTIDGTAATAPTLAVTISTASVSAAIQCGADWSVITTNTWTGKIRVEISTDGGNNWSLVQSLASSSSSNYNTSGSTGVRQCLIRVSADPTVAFTGTANIDLTSQSFDWTGIVQITAVASGTSATANVINISNTDSTGLANTSATYQWSEGSWSTYRGFPACATFFQDRLCWASTPAEPETIWMSQTGNYTNFGISSPLVDSDSISVVLPSRSVNIIQNLIVMPQGMIALTSDSEWAIAVGANGVLSPTSINTNLQGHRGSASISPVVCGIEIILLEQLGTIVRNLIYQLYVSGFMGDNISIISQHLFTGFTISEMAYQQEPDSIIWLVRSDGKLLSLTYMREQEVQAWTWHDSVGTFESVACIRSSANGFTEPWFVYNLNGTRYIVRMVARDMGTTPSSQFFVDCGLSYSGVAATVITGLAHLNGQKVSVLADGNVIPNISVAGGQITLAVAASTVHVGLPYVSDVESLQIEAQDPRGTLQGRRVAIPRVTLRFWNSRGGYTGPEAPSDDTVTTLDPITQRTIDDDFNVAIPLKTQDYQMVLQGGYDFGAHVFFRQVDPLPFCLLAFIPQIVPAEN